MMRAVAAIASFEHGGVHGVHQPMTSGARLVERYLDAAAAQFRRETAW